MRARRRARPALLAALAAAAASCAAQPVMPPVDAGGPRPDAPRVIDVGPPPLEDAPPPSGDGGFVCPVDGVRGRGRHRLFVQGHGAPSLPDGTWPLLHEWRSDGSDAVLCDDRVFVTDTSGDGRWQPGEDPLPLGPDALVHGEHFLVGPGAFVEFTTTLCEDITGEVVFYIPNFDQEGSASLHELFVVHDGVETLIAEATDDEPGFSGYNPFVRVLSGVDPDVVPGDRLLLRSTNLSGVGFSVMVWQPPSEYESWIVVEVP